MATLTLYGSSVADGTLTTACDMASTTGGSETSKTTITTGQTNNFVEVYSQGNAGATSVTAIPATPTGHGWVYRPGTGVFAAGNWSATITVNVGFGAGGQLTLRLFQYSSGVYTLIGSIVVGSLVSGVKTAYSFSATAMPAMMFGVSDLLYSDLWFRDTTNVGGDNPIVYVSSSASQGVANDMQITTADFGSFAVVPVKLVTRDGLATAVTRDGVGLTTKTRG